MLFGHQNDDTNQQPAQDALAPQETPLAPPPAPADPTPSSGINPLAVDHETGASLPTVTPHSLDQPDESEPSVLDQPSAPNLPPIEPTTPFASEHAVADQPSAPRVEPTALDTPEVDEPPVTPATHTPAPVNDDLLHLKQQALSQLSPLVGQLEQNPEEKFRTTMMLIQSTDNQSLLKEAYDAAQAITDEKVRAQALLDVVNEINYFTQQKPAA